MKWLRAPDTASWLERNQNFTVSTAPMSIARYGIGFGDRHPSNIMVQRHSERVIHIDFGDSFDVTMHRTAFAERVPCRIIRMMVNPLGASSVDF
jgi:phosphatidylinositol kinase/protein kinase (PI-3  family)